MSTLEEIKAQYDRASEELDRLTAGKPGTAWRWSIPANPERDSDLILADPLAAVPKLLAAVEAVEALTKGWHAAYVSHKAEDGGRVTSEAIDRLDDAAYEIEQAIAEALQ